MKPSIVLVVTDQESNAQIKPLGVDFLELRVDLFRETEIGHSRRQFEKRRRLRIPLILTVRNQKSEGARQETSDAEKWDLLKALVPVTDWVDIEMSSQLCAKTVALARSLNKKVLISAHDFNRIPPLEQLLKKALSTRADLVKIAACANSPADFMRMMEFTHQHAKQPIVTMCVGQWGPLSRLMLPAVGSRWVYTFLSQSTAPGQLDIKTLQSHFKSYYSMR